MVRSIPRIFQTQPADKGIEFALIPDPNTDNQILAPLEVLNKPDIAYPAIRSSKYRSYDRATRDFFERIRDWGLQHPEAFEAAQREILRFKLYLFHNKYQRELETLEETKTKLAVSLVNFLQGGGHF